MEKQKKSAFIFNAIRTVLVYLFAIAIVVSAIFFAMDKSPQKSVFGFRYYTILTPSMEPAYSVGDVVIVKLTNADEINTGDVITFNPSSDSNAYLTHRVTEKIQNYEGTGVTCFRTKGDSNNAEDSFLIDSSRVIGKVSFSVPKIGYIIRFVQLRWYFVIPLAIMFFVLLKLMKIYFSYGKDNSDEPQNNEESAEN